MIRNLRTLLNGLRNVRSRVFRLAVECLRLAQRLDWPSPGVQAPPITVDRPLRRYFPPSRVSANWRNSEIRGEAVGLEPTTRVLWNSGVSDQLTRSNTMHSSSNSSAFFGIFHKGEFPVAPECGWSCVERWPLAGIGARRLPVIASNATDSAKPCLKLVGQD